MAVGDEACNQQSEQSTQDEDQSCATLETQLILAVLIFHYRSRREFHWLSFDLGVKAGLARH